MIFTPARLKDNDYPNKLIIGRSRVEYSQSVKYLGITLDHRLSWTTHIDTKISKAKRSLFALRQAISKKWGPKPAYMKWAYNAIIKSRLLYGSVVWGKAAQHKTQKDKLNT